MAFHTKVFTLKSTTNDTFTMVNPDRVEMATFTRAEDEISVVLHQARNVIRFTIVEDQLDTVKNGLRGVDGIEIDAEYLTIEPLA
jgi:hypothetical protein